MKINIDVGGDNNAKLKKFCHSERSEDCETATK